LEVQAMWAGIIAAIIVGSVVLGILLGWVGLKQK
jgi:hypothetical protein